MASLATSYAKVLGVLFFAAVVFQFADANCPRGWITYGSGRSATCFRVYSDLRKNFNSAQRYCQQQGGYLARDTSSGIHNKLKPYVKNAAKSRTHPTSLWIGLTDLNKNGGPWSWVGGSSLGSFHYWTSTPRNTANKQDCFYVVPAERYQKWHVTNNCGANKALICQRDYAHVDVKTTPAPRVTCPNGWKIYNPTRMCVRLYLQAKQWTDARAFCQQTGNGGDLLKIVDGRMNGFINGLVQRQKSYYWIGLHDRHKENKFEWLDETTPTKFAYWNPHEPNNAGGNENCVSIIGTRGSRWNDAQCTSRYRFICQQPAVVNGHRPPAPSTTPISRNCGSGWEDDPNTDYCFQFNLDLLSWLDALAYCKSNGGDLASVSNIQEMSYLSGRSMAFDFDQFWLGANDRGTEKGWQWTDRKPFPFFNWDVRQPDNHHNQDCVVMVQKTGKWDDFDCTQRLPSICKKVGHITHPSPRPTTPPRRIPSGKAWTCPSGWSPYRGSCYQVLRSPSGLSWDLATSVCSARLGHLAAITDASENKFVYSLIPKSKIGNGYVWIGLNDKYTENSFVWSDNTPVSYTLWNTGEPNNMHDEDCVVMLQGTGKWNDARCSTPVHLMVCKQNKAIHDNSEFEINKGCRTGYKGYGAQCYNYVYSPKKTFAQAEAACKAGKGHLATVNNRQVQAFVDAEMYHLPGDAYWIGLSSQPSTNNAYQWTSGYDVDYTNWGVNHTGIEKNTCIGMRVPRPSGLWLNFPCTTTKSYICEYPRQGFTTPIPTTTTTSRLPCPTGWIGWGNTCYKAFADNPLSWSDARDFCGTQAMFGTLATVRNARFNTWMNKWIAQNNKGSGLKFWIGLNDKDTEGGYKWLDSSPYVYTNWASGEPNDYQKREDCVEMYLDSGYWNDNYCYLANNYVCQVPRGSAVTTPKPTPTIGITTTQCGNSSWTLFNKNCYFVSAETGPMAELSWFDARLVCLQMGAELASIGGEDENGYLTTIISQHPISSFWIGMSDLDQDTYKWNDQSPVYYVSWNKDEPNDARGGERCVEMHSNGLWNDLHCQDTDGYVCKKRPGNFVPPPSTAAPSGGCPANFHGMDGTSRCFYVGGKTQDTRKNYTSAITACNTVMQNSKLASISSGIDEKFVITLLAGLQTPAWIGFNDRRQSNHFEWIDNRDVNYAHWGWGQPDENLKDPSLDARRDCVDMETVPRYAGNWNDKKCLQKYAYVCEYRKDPQYAIEKTYTLGCQPGYTRFRNSCYKYIISPANWQSSENACVKDNGHLVSMEDKFETAFVELLTKGSSGTQIWLGLSYSYVSYTYQWSDGWPVLYTHWGKGEPDRDQGEGCVSHTMDGAWQDVPCQMSLSYVCEVNLEPAPKATASSQGSCPDSTWTSYGEYCYQLNTKNTKSWPGARYVCSTNQGSSLVTIHSDDEARFITKLISTNQVNSWIGLSRGTSSGFSWGDHSEVEYLNWATGAPNDPDVGMHQDCVIVQGTDGTWLDTDCFDSNAYICKVKQRLMTPAPTRGWVPIIATIPGGGNALATWPWNNNHFAPYTNQQPPKGLVTPAATRGPYGVNTYSPYNPYATRPWNNNNFAPYTNQKTSKDDSSLSGGGVAGVVLGSIALVCLAAIVIFVSARYFQTKRPGMFSGAPAGFDNATYSSGQGETVSFPNSDA